MAKLIFGLVIVGIILFIIYQARKESERVKGIMNADEGIHNAQTKLAELDKRDELANTRKKVQTREKAVTRKEDKLDKE